MKEHRHIDIAHMAMGLEYGKAAEALALAGVTDAPFWNCVSHAFELSLKAVLLLKGMEEMLVITLIQHDLKQAVAAIYRLDPDFRLITGEAKALIDHLSIYSRQQDFRYPSYLERPGMPEPVNAVHILCAHLNAFEDYF